MTTSSGNIKLFFILAGSVFLFLYGVLPFIHPINGHDAWVHLNWLEQFTAEFRAGDLYPKWLPNSFYGMGSASFYFYPPLVYWVASVVSILNPQSVQFTYYATVFVGAAFSFVTSYLLFRRFASKQLAIMGSFLYILAPYAIANIFRRTAFSEQFALAFLPLIFIAIELAREDGKGRLAPKAIFTMAVGTAGLLLGSVPLTTVAIYTTPIYYILRMRAESLSKSPPVVIGALLGVCIASIYLLPIIEFYPTVRTSDLWGVNDPYGKLIYALTFLSASGGGALFYHVAFAFTIFGYLLTAYVLFALIKKEVSSERRPVLIALAGVACFICILQLPFLQVIWDHAPFIRMSQFTWRFNAVFALVFPLVLLILFDTNRKWFYRIATTVVLGTGLLGVGYIFRLEKIHYFEESLVGYRDVTEYVSNVSGSQRPVQLFEVFGSFANEADVRLEHPVISNAIVIDRKEATAISFSTRFDTSATVRFRRQYFPQWTLVDEKNTHYALIPDSTTRFTAVLPAGDHRFRLYLEESPLEKAGRWLSVTGLVITGVFGYLVFRRRSS